VVELKVVNILPNNVQNVKELVLVTVNVKSKEPVKKQILKNPVRKSE
jgi:hypothetical protein